MPIMCNAALGSGCLGGLLSRPPAHRRRRSAARLINSPPDPRRVLPPRLNLGTQSVIPTDIALVQSTFRRIVPSAEQAGALFYARLFELDPALRALFRGDMREQGCTLIAMLSKTVSLLDQPDTLIPIVRTLGARHNSYGVLAEHYATVGAALLWTLQKGLGREFTPAVATAWSNTYSFLAHLMVEAQRGRLIRLPN